MIQTALKSKKANQPNLVLREEAGKAKGKCREAKAKADSQVLSTS